VQINLLVYHQTNGYVRFRLDDSLHLLHSTSTSSNDELDASRLSTTKVSVIVSQASSLPTCYTSLNVHNDQTISQHRHVANKSVPDVDQVQSAVLVTSFLQHLRQQLRITASEKKHSCNRHEQNVRISRSIFSKNAMLIVDNSLLYFRALTRK
jgi:hypothetical protein